MLFSIIIPIYNVEKYLNECVDSVLAQDYADYELILVDDGSLDSCPEICDKYAESDSRITVIHKENGGLSDARNAGILKAQGDYLIFLDSDDYWSSNIFLSHAADVIHSQSTDIVLYGGCKIVNNVKVDGRQRNFSEYKNLDEIQTLRKMVEEGKLGVTAWSMCIRRMFILDNGLLFVKGLKSEDIEWSIRMFICLPSWSFLDESIYVYRRGREGSISSSVDYKHLSQYCDIIEMSIKRVLEAGGPVVEPLMSYLMYQLTICSALISDTPLSKTQRRDLHARLKPLCKKYILKYRLNRKARLAGTVYRFFGYTGMAKVLGWYLK